MVEQPHIHNENKGPLQEKGNINQGVQYFYGTEPEKPLEIDWHSVCQSMLPKRLTSNSLFHDDEEAKKERQ